VPTAPPVTQRRMVEMLCDAAGREHIKVRATPRVALRLAGLASPLIRELIEVSYQFERPFVIDSTLTTRTFGIEATPLRTSVSAAIPGAPAESNAR